MAPDAPTPSPPPSSNGSARAAEAAQLRSALPSTGARVLAFSSILVAGLCGGLIGDAIVDLQCTGDCGTARGLGALVGALLCAGGVAVVAILVLRAMTEWRSIEHREAQAPTSGRGRGRRT
jgi:predicted lipid-binding transport protein (Tim44 family)